MLTLSSIFISSEEMNRRIIFAVKQWNWLDGISSIYFPCLSIYQWCLLELNSCRWKVQKELSLNKVYWSQFSVSLHPSIFWFLERVSQLFMSGKFTKKYNSIETLKWKYFSSWEMCKISFSNNLVTLNLKEKWIGVNY